MHLAPDQKTITLRLPAFYWNVFNRREVEARLVEWQQAAVGPCFRQPLDVQEEQGDLVISLPAVPAGYRSLAEIGAAELSDSLKATVLIHICEALSVLHQQDFTMGFLAPEHLHVHPETGDVLIDVQPWPSTTPFVDHMLERYPFVLLSGYSRKHAMPRVADYYSVGLLTQWLYTGRLPGAARTVVDDVPLFMRELVERLMTDPRQFLFADEIADEFRLAVGRAPLFEQAPVGPGHPSCLHPMAPPISVDEQEKLRRFLRDEGVGVMAIVSEDEIARHDVVRTHLLDEFEHDMFLTISCRNFPFSALSETIERLMTVTNDLLPELGGRLRSCSQQFHTLLRKHYEGDDVVQSLADFLFLLIDELQPLFDYQSVYFVYEGCEELDEDSQRVLLSFWRTYKQRIRRLHALFSGRRVPKQFEEIIDTLVEIGGDDPVRTRRLVQSMLGRADDLVLQKMTGWLIRNDVHSSNLPLLLQSWIELGQIELTRKGWKIADRYDPSLCLDGRELLNRLIEKRLALLEPHELEVLRTFACIPKQIRARSMYRASGLDHEALSITLRRLGQLGLIKIYYENGVYLLPEVVRRLRERFTPEQLRLHSERALQLLYRYRPRTFPPLIALTQQAGDTYKHYYFLIRYYRQVRAMLSLERRHELVDQLLQLQQELGRRVNVWQRLLADIYYRKVMVQESVQLLHTLYARTSDVRDLCNKWRAELVTGDLDIERARTAAFGLLHKEELRLTDRVHAMVFCLYTDHFLPMGRERAEELHQFFTEAVHPLREQIPPRLYTMVTVSYAIMLFQLMPDKADTANVLLEMIEALLEHRGELQQLPIVYEAYIFHANISVARSYIQRGLELARRRSDRCGEQLYHVNGMEMALYQGDLTGYHYHEEQAKQLGEIKRKDFREQYLLHQFLQALEWEDWKAFGQFERDYAAEITSPFALTHRDVLQHYSGWLRGDELPPLLDTWSETNPFADFVRGLHAARMGDADGAIDWFRRSLDTNGYHLGAGWCYREGIALLLQQDVQTAGEWLRQFEDYLKRYHMDVFWPDYYRLSAQAAFARGDDQRGILFLRRAQNAYQLIGKEGWRFRIALLLEKAVAPSYLPATTNLLLDPAGRALLADRARLLHQSLDLMIIIQLSEQVTESLDLKISLQRLTNALFEYFPVTYADVRCNLHLMREDVYYTASGQVASDEMLLERHAQRDDETLTYTLYEHGSQSVTLKLSVQEMEETKRQHMEQFLSFLKPHIANAIHYMEMMTDTLTGFYQRRYFNERLKQELELSQRYGLDLSLIMIDIDNFRSVNAHGHQEGDVVLHELSELIRAVLHKNDAPVRYGGEELLIILPMTDGRVALQIAETIRARIEDAFSEGRPYTVTVSVGVSSRHLCRAETVDEMIFLADTAEIHAKTSGKNRVVAAWELS